MSMEPSILKSGATLALIAAVCTALVAATYQATAERIAANEKALLEQSLQPAIGSLMFEGDISESRLDIEPPHDLPGNETAIVYRLFAGEEPVGADSNTRVGDTDIEIVLGVEGDGRVFQAPLLRNGDGPNVPGAAGR